MGGSKSPYTYDKAASKILFVVMSLKAYPTEDIQLLSEGSEDKNKNIEIEI